MFPIIAVGLWGFISIVVGTIYPAVIQKFTVQPNELTKETAVHRTATSRRRATRSGCRRSRRKHVQLRRRRLSNAATAGGEAPTLDNVRLYDPLPAHDAFKVTQEVTPFYSFTDVDVDRYKIGDETAKPILASVRELDLAHLPDNSWTSQHLVYTHGYGAVAAAANEVNADQPSYVLDGHPADRRAQQNLDPKYTGVYFGRGPRRLLGRRHQGRRARGDERRRHQGHDVPGHGRRARCRASCARPRSRCASATGTCFVSGQVTNNSRVIYIRDVMQRVKTIAPFLKFDSDPYPVVVDGRIQWVLDAYTTTNDYPYSQSIHPQEPAGSGLDTDFNYVRNSVKATVDAYDGTVHFYVVDPTDPIIKTYRKAFPELFQDLSAMPRRAARRTSATRRTSSTRRPSSTRCTTSPIRCSTSTSRRSGTSRRAPTRSSAAAGRRRRSTPRRTTAAATRRSPSAGSPINPLYLTMALPDGRRPTGVRRRNSSCSSDRSRHAARAGSCPRSSSRGPTATNYGKLVVYEVPDTVGAVARAGGDR